MARIKAEGLTTFEAAPGKRLVLALEDAGIDIFHRCGGKARCTTCRVEMLDGDAGPMTNREQRRLMRTTDVTPTMRLSCQVLDENDLHLRVVNRLSESDVSDAGPRPSDILDPDMPPIQSATGEATST
jgi:ferredoxin